MKKNIYLYLTFSVFVFIVLGLIFAIFDSVLVFSLGLLLATLASVFVFHYFLEDNKK